MRRSFVHAIAVAGLVGLFWLAPAMRLPCAKGDQPAVEALPAPRALNPVVVVPGPVLPPYPVYHRTSHYDVWQKVAVDRQGYFRLRVIYSPSGPYYLYNGQPYPWAEQHPLAFMPYIVD
jgi:hypothetical protein